MNPVKSNSEWGKAAQVGSQVGLPLKDAINTGIYVLVIFTGLLSCILGPLFNRIHS